MILMVSSKIQGETQEVDNATSLIYSAKSSTNLLLNTLPKRCEVAYSVLHCLSDLLNRVKTLLETHLAFLLLVILVLRILVGRHVVAVVAVAPVAPGAPAAREGEHHVVPEEDEEQEHRDHVGLQVEAAHDEEDEGHHAPHGRLPLEAALDVLAPVDHVHHQSLESHHIANKNLAFELGFRLHVFLLFGVDAADTGPNLK